MQSVKGMPAPDFELPPRPAVSAQAAALRAAFPTYTINVLKCRGEKARFEAVSKTGGNPYCVISADARVIWRELKEAASPSTDFLCRPRAARTRWVTVSRSGRRARGRSGRDGTGPVRRGGPAAGG
jgi:hypothetical protein